MSDPEPGRGGPAVARAIPVVILAGGLGRRLGGGDKPLRKLAGRTLAEHARDRLAPQTETLGLNANGDAARFAFLQLPVIPDVMTGFPGPLAGILTAMRWVQARRPGVSWLVSAPADTPFLPGDLVARLFSEQSRTGAEIAVANSYGRDHPVVALWPIAIAASLQAHLEAGDDRRVGSWLHRFRTVSVTFAAERPEGVDPFFNVNTPQDLEAAEAYLAAREASPTEVETGRRIPPGRTLKPGCGVPGHAPAHLWRSGLWVKGRSAQQFGRPYRVRSRNCRVTAGVTTVEADRSTPTSS